MAAFWQHLRPHVAVALLGHLSGRNLKRAPAAGEAAAAAGEAAGEAGGASRPLAPPALDLPAVGEAAGAGASSSSSLDMCVINATVLLLSEAHRKAKNGEAPSHSLDLILAALAADAAADEDNGRADAAAGSGELMSPPPPPLPPSEGSQQQEVSLRDGLVLALKHWSAYYEHQVECPR